jgi:transcription initiation factor TFIIH subunit 4
MAEFGLLYCQDRSTFYPTQFGAKLLTGLLHERHSSTTTTTTTTTTTMAAEANEPMILDDGYIIVETNFRIYAYTSSPLQIKLLSLFVALQYRLPNMVVGMITRQRVREALIKGITANQILSFLRTNSHPKAKQRIPAVPECVSDQILLWEAERNRVTMQAGHLYDNFPNAQVFNGAHKHAQDNGWLLWSHNEPMYLMISPEGHNPMRAFIRETYT